MKWEFLAGLAGAVLAHAALVLFLCARPLVEPAALAGESAAINFNFIADQIPAPPAAVLSTPPAPAPAPEPAATPQPEPLPAEQTALADTIPDQAPIIQSSRAATNSEPARGQPAKPSRLRRTGNAVAESRAAGAPAGRQGVAAIGTMARYRVNPQPGYPPESRRLHQQGVVMLDVIVGANGRVNDVSIIRSTGYPSLDRAAVQAVREWLFDPARAAGVAVESHVKVPVRFTLTG